jgi:hypothetical protein
LAVRLGHTPLPPSHRAGGSVRVGNAKYRLLRGFDTPKAETCFQCGCSGATRPWVKGIQRGESTATNPLRLPMACQHIRKKEGNRDRVSISDAEGGMRDECSPETG